MPLSRGAESMSREPELVNKAFRAILLALDEVVGKHGVAAILHQANLPQYINHYPPSTMERRGHLACYVGHIGRVLHDVYGARGSRAILRRVGRNEAVSGIAENAAIANATKLALRFLPRRLQVKLVLDTAAKQVNEQIDTVVRVVEDGAHFYYEDAGCIHCIDWQSATPICYTLAGFIHGLLAWALENEEFTIEEIECRAKGDALCKFRITLK